MARDPIHWTKTNAFELPCAKQYDVRVTMVESVSRSRAASTASGLDIHDVEKLRRLSSVVTKAQYTKAPKVK